MSQLFFINIISLFFCIVKLISGILFYLILLKFFTFFIPSLKTTWDSKRFCFLIVKCFIIFVVMVRRSLCVSYGKFRHILKQTVKI